MGDVKNLNLQDLDEVIGGKSGSSTSWKSVTVTGTKNYLAIRTEAAYDEKNEIGKFHNGDHIKIRPDIRSGSYVWASGDGKEGWVNGKYVK